MADCCKDRNKVGLEVASEALHDCYRRNGHRALHQHLPGKFLLTAWSTAARILTDRHPPTLHYAILAEFILTRNQFRWALHQFGAAWSSSEEVGKTSAFRARDEGTDLDWCERKQCERHRCITNQLNQSMISEGPIRLQSSEGILNLGKPKPRIRDLN